MPIQSTTDRGSETTEIYGIVNALRWVYCSFANFNLFNTSTSLISARELFGNDLAIEEIPAHRFLKSVHNITIERGWLRLRLQWGDNIVYWWNQGELLGIYKPDDPRHQWVLQVANRLINWLLNQNTCCMALVDTHPGRAIQLTSCPLWQKEILALWYLSNGGHGTLWRFRCGILSTAGWH